MGIALALAGADVLLTDLPHVTPLARDNVSDNCCSQRIRAQARFRLHVLLQNMREAIKTHHGVLCSDDGANAGLPQVVDYAWGSHVAVLGEPPDIITGADIVYQKEFFPQLVHTLESASAPHTIIYLAFRLRGKHAITFAGLICSLRCSQESFRVVCQDVERRTLRPCWRIETLQWREFPWACSTLSIRAGSTECCEPVKGAADVCAIRYKQ